MKIRRIFKNIRNEARIYWALFRDHRTPKISKILIILAIAYLLWPFDLIPDFLPFAGLVDEIIILPLLFYIATLFIPKHVVEDNRQKISGKKAKFENVKEGEIEEGEIVG